MKKVLIWTASIILFIELLDTTILYACFVPIADDFGISSSRMSLPVLSYIVGTCIFIPMVSWISNRFNKINIIINTLVAFSIFSLLCSISKDLYIFSIFRFLQGAAISIAGSMTIIILLSVCKSEEIVKTMGTINIPALLGTGIGPLVGAIFSYYLSWRIAFFINFPVCVVIALSLIRLRSDPMFCSKPELTIKKFDCLGFMLISVFLIMTSIGFEQLSSAINPINLFLILSGIIFGVVYVIIWRQRLYSKQNSSILDLSVFRNTDFLFGTIVNIIARSAMCGVPVLLSIIIQQLYGFSVIKAGFYLAIIAVAGIIAKFLSSFIKTIGVHQTIAISSILTSLSIASLSLHEFWISNGCLWIPCFLLGFTMSLLYTSMNSVMYLTLKKSEISNASNIGSIIQQFGIGAGVVAAVGGFQFLASLDSISFQIGGIQTHMANAFQMICYLLAVLMMFNLIIAIPFQFLYKKNFSIDDKIEANLGYE